MSEHVFQSEADQEINFDINQILSKAREIIRKIPEIVDKTIAVKLVSEKIPEAGIDIADAARMGVQFYLSENPVQGNAKIASEIAGMSDSDIIGKAQDFLKSKGLDELSENIADGNISRKDVIQGLSEFGHAMSSQSETDIHLLSQVRSAMGDIDDPSLLEGLVLAEQYIDDTMTNMANSMAEKYDAGNIGVFDKSATGLQEPSENMKIMSPSQTVVPKF